ncbi:MAG: DUF1573 domain-containing protein, partial [Planctomycetota bacterium]
FKTYLSLSCNLFFPQRYFLLAIVFFLFILYSNLLLGKEGKEKGPRIYFPRKMVEFGEALQGEDVVHIFRFQNRGDKPLKIVKIKSSCLCAPSLLSKKILQPGEEGRIKVTFHTMNLAPQYYDLYVDIFHNDPHEKDNGQFVSRLRLSGRVIMVYQIYPLGGGYLGTFEVASPPKRTFKIISTVGKGFTIKKIEYPKKKIKVSVKPLPLSGGRLAQELHVEILPNQPPGEFVAPMKIYTTHPRQPILYFKIWGMGLGEVVAEPSYLLFGPVRRKGNRQRIVSVFLRHGTGLKILDIKYDEKFFEIQKDELLEGKKFELTIKIKKNVPAGPFAKKIRILTNHPRQPLFEISVLGTMEKEIRVFPRALLLKKSNIGKWQEVQIYGPPDLKLEALPFALKGLEWNLLQKDKGHFLLKVRSNRFPLPQNSLPFKTNQIGEEKLFIPFFSDKK